MPATDQFRWNQKTLHIVFAASSIFLLASVIAMMKEDQADEWRAYQRTNFDLQAAMNEHELQSLQTDEFLAQLEELKTSRDAADDQVAEFETAQRDLLNRADQDLRLVEKLEIELKFKNSIRDEARGNYNLAIRDGVSGTTLQNLFARFSERQQECDDAQAALDDAKAALEETNSQIREATAERDRLNAALEKATSEVARVQAVLENIRPSTAISRWKRAMMELPIIDGFNSHLRIEQDWLPGLSQVLGMTEIARFDRCRSCHLNIDRTAAGNKAAFPAGHPSTDDVKTWVAESKFPQPFSTHPNHDLFCTASSPHPVAKFGCTTCHEGQGSGTSFGNAEHTPNDPHMAHIWEKEYGYHPNHFWEYPMQPERFAESTCIKCHHQVTELGVNPRFGASAPKVFEGYELVIKYGCYGCHEIHGDGAGGSIGPDLRLEPQTPEEAARVAADPGQVPGIMRKVGPSFRHIASKTSREWIEYWTEIPSRYRPTTKMPQFFHLSNQDDELAARYQPVELAGLAHVLTHSSEPIDLLSPASEYEPSVERGQQLFTERGCLACHQHKAVPASQEDFGPNISDIHLKVKRNADNAEFSDWLYTWIREPDRYHARTRMPNLYLTPFIGNDGVTEVDPAADIVAFLLSHGEPGQYSPLKINDADLDELVTLYLNKARFSVAVSKRIAASGQYPQKMSDVAGDEAVLATEDGSPLSDELEWRNRKLEYVGRKTVSKYGCYACHDMPGYELARPIGVALQDWGRKDTSKLGFEHIQEFLHHHGEHAESKFSSTAHRVDQALRDARAGLLEKGQISREESDSGLSAAFYYDSIIHHGRPGFIWQKLREPRSYDYMSIQTKGYDDRLRMPKFPLDEREIESIATFILGLVAEPPSSEYIHTPDEREKTRIQGEVLLAKYNCTGCHMVELPKVTFGANLDDIFATEMTPADHEAALDLLTHFRPPRQALTGETRTFRVDDEDVELPVAAIRGLRYSFPDPEEDPEYQENGFDAWETVDFGEGDDQKRLLPGSRVLVPQAVMMDYQPGRGGRWAEWLVEELMQTRTGDNRYLAWQASPPPLIQEGFKVQTSWLHRFLLEPSQLRYTTVMRMPQFNMSSEEAGILANYFAAVDGARFPYDEVEPASRSYLSSRAAELAHAGLLSEGEGYLEESWKSLNGPLCIKCHSVGGRRFKVSDPAKDIRGPNLNITHQRLRADWLALWLYKPTWITPYTSMPVNFPKNNTTQFPDLFQGDPGAQAIGTRDALLNYIELMENVGATEYAPPGAETPSVDVSAGAEE